MKKILVLFTIAIVFTQACIAQSSSPRFGTAPNQDNTGRVLNYVYRTATDATAADSIVINANAWETVYNITLKDSFTLKQPLVTHCFFGDQLVLVCSAPSGTPFLKFTGSLWVTTGKATLSTGLRAIIKLRFDGAKWVEESRVVQ